MLAYKVSYDKKEKKKEVGIKDDDLLELYIEYPYTVTRCLGDCKV